MSSSPTDDGVDLPFVKMEMFVKMMSAAVLGVLLAGCIADTAEDTDLPWASNQRWEGVAPVGPSMMDRYE